MKPEGLWERVAAGLGRAVSPAQEGILHRYLDWLAGEAIPAGAVGPAELDRLHDRHIADSLLFLHGWDRPREPETIWDLGSGAGLPGIPLAILLPDSTVTLVDRSARRAELLRRAVRVLDLDNTEVIEADVDRLEDTAAMIVSRATLPPERLSPVVRRHLDPGGRAVLGGSWLRPPQAPLGWEVKEIPRDSLDRTVWLLIMRG